MTTALEALQILCSKSDIETVLDVGSGAGEHAKIMRYRGKTVLTNSLEPPADLLGDFMQLSEDMRFNAVWAAHVLEHQPNPGLFLQKCFRLLTADGWLFVTVPPRKDEIVGGHCTLWNAGILLYQLILAGFDCSKAMVKTYGYNISVVVQKSAAEYSGLRMDTGDIEKLAAFFPMDVQHGFNGNIKEVNWPV